MEGAPGCPHRQATGRPRGIGGEIRVPFHGFDSGRRSPNLGRPAGVIIEQKLQRSSSIEVCRGCMSSLSALPARRHVPHTSSEECFHDVGWASLLEGNINMAFCGLSRERRREGVRLEPFRGDCFVLRRGGSCERRVESAVVFSSARGLENEKCKNKNEI